MSLPYLLTTISPRLVFLDYYFYLDQIFGSFVKIMAEPYQKVGRGGAGNFYSKSDIEEVNKTAETVRSSPYPYTHAYTHEQP